jgi:hypothetical protein
VKPKACGAFSHKLKVNLDHEPKVFLLIDIYSLFLEVLLLFWTQMTMPEEFLLWDAIPSYLAQRDLIIEEGSSSITSTYPNPVTLVIFLFNTC